MNPYSISSRAANTSAGMIVFLFADRVNSFDLIQVASLISSLMLLSACATGQGRHTPKLDG